MAGLRETLSNLTAAARAQKGQAVRARLPRGLTVALKTEDGEALSVQLSRADVYPSTQEWKTVIGLLPRNVEVERPRPLIHEHIYYLKGQVRLAGRLMQ